MRSRFNRVRPRFNYEVGLTAAADALPATVTCCPWLVVCEAVLKQLPDDGSVTVGRLPEQSTPASAPIGLPQVTVARRPHPAVRQGSLNSLN
ncbi:hypothetical protein [Streptomyces sp. NPDC088246]|uniref:hypothetical protein n=1 Tax=Streptomyces sp. NPDC088246 TaxID=3365842 RepID=UPI00382C39B7